MSDKNTEKKTEDTKAEESKTEEKSEKKRLPRWAKVSIIVGSVLVVLALGVFIAIKVYLARVPRIQEKERLDPASETFERSTEVEGASDTINVEDVKWDELYADVMKDSDIKNILLIGHDGRPGDTGSHRSDSIILCSINKVQGKINLVSFMRDMYVPIPGYSDNRINAAFSFGGASLLKETIEQDFGISIDNCVEINFDGFIQAMTAVGDLEIELTAQEADYLNETGNIMNLEEGLPESDWNLKEGKNLLRPDQVLAYSRTRYVGRSDYERTERQRKVLTASFNKISKLGLSDQVDLANAIIPHIATDMSDMEILGYVYYVVKDGVNIGDSNRVPADKSYTNEMINGMSVLLPKLAENTELLKTWLYQGIASPEAAGE